MLTMTNRLHIWKALFAGKHFNSLALACICATLVLMGEVLPAPIFRVYELTKRSDGPLLQRASSVTSVLPKEPVPVTIAMAPQIPALFTG
jgi:hypothetical protein